MIGLTYKQQCQTSFKWKPYTEELWQSIDKAKDPNNTCPYCKNDNTTPVTDSSVLLSYSIIQGINIQSVRVSLL